MDPLAAPSAPAAWLEGVVGAALTPFATDRSVDLTVLGEQLDLLSGHCDVISVLGAEVSEYRVLTPAARRDALRAAIELVDRRRPVLAGVSSSSIAEIAELAELAAHAGADAAQLLLPAREWGGEPTAAELVAFVEAAVAASPLPVVVYHNPGWGADPSIDALVAVTAIDGVIGIKDSSRNVSRILRLAEEIEVSNQARYLTTVQPLLTTLLAGGAGAMMPPPATLLGARIVAAVAEGDLAAAAAHQRALARFPAQWAGKYGLAPVMKAALAHLGLAIGAPANPASALPAPDVQALGRELDRWPSLLSPSSL
jgi:4-hydroxy-tetrahydrodipicolinate synthase